MATNYAPIAQQMLFDPSRNPNVPVEQAPPPPPPPPMPPLPAYHGMMNIGDSGPMAFLSIGNGRNQAIHIGEPIGAFKLLDVNSDEVTFEWDSKPVKQQFSRPTIDMSQQGGGDRTDVP